MTGKWVSIGANEAITYGFHTVTAENRRIVIASLEGELFAFDAFCPHAGGPMECAEVKGAVITCPLHGWRFDLRRAGFEIHGYRNLKTLDVKIENGQVYVHI